MATNVESSRPLAELDVPQAGREARSISWEMVLLVGGIVLASVALLYLPYFFGTY